MEEKIFSADSSLDERKPGAAQSKIFHGWFMVVTSFFIQGIGVGNQYVTGLFVEPLTAAVGASTASMLFCTSGVLMIVAGVFSPACGYLLQRFSIRVTTTAGMVAIAAGYLLLGFVNALWQVAIIYGCLFAFGSLVANIAGNALVANWFYEERGKALGLAATGITAAGFVIPPLASYGMGQFGFSTTCTMAAILVGLSALSIYKIIIDKPESKGLLPCGHVEPKQATSTGDIKAASLKIGALVIQWNFWRITLPVAVSSAILTVMMNALIPFAQSSGIPTQQASYLVSIAALSGFFGMVAFGKLFDILSNDLLLYALTGFAATPCLIALYQTSYIQWVITSVFLGLGSGAAVVAAAALAANSFQRKDFSVVLGAMSFVLVSVYAVNLISLGWMHELFGSYRYPMMLFVVESALIVMVIRFGGCNGGAESSSAAGLEK